jgi:hypothetical protein
VALKIFSDLYQTYNGSPFPELQSSHLSWTLGTQAPNTGPTTDSITTNGIAGVILVPEPKVTFYLNQSGVNGVLTHLEFTPVPGGSIQGSTITVEECVGAFAYDPSVEADYLALLNYISSSQNTNSIIQFNNIDAALTRLYGGTSPAPISNQISAAVNQAKAGGDTTFANLAQPLVQIVSQWDSPQYFVDVGAGLQNVSLSSIAFGLDLLSVNGALSTWAVSGSTGSVSVSGYTAVGHQTIDSAGTLFLQYRRCPDRWLP